MIQIQKFSSDLGGFLDYHISYGLQERPKNLVDELMNFDFSGTDEEVGETLQFSVGGASGSKF